MIPLNALLMILRRPPAPAQNEPLSDYKDVNIYSTTKGDAK